MPRLLASERLISTLAAVVLVVLVFAPVARAQALPLGWSRSDIGGSAVPGTVSVSTGTFSISSRGWDVAGTSDQVTFLSTPVTGDVSLVARIDSLQAVNDWSLAGLMLRESLSATSKHVSIFVTPARGLLARARASTGGGTVQALTGSGRAPIWLRLDRQSATVRLYWSTGSVWTLMTTISLPLNTAAVVGLAVASHSTTASVAASMTGVALNGVPVTAPLPGVNVPPVVSLSTPLLGATYAAPATISMSAIAADADGSISKVDFYAGSTLVGSDTTSPYTFAWGNVPIGSYVLKAVATDSGGATTSSAAVTATVNANKAPLVSLVSPLAGATFIAPATITLSATASDLDGSIQRVEFYRGSTLLASDSSSPYTFNWQNVPAGSYSIAAVARDNLGASTVSSWRDLQVGSTSTLSKAIFTPAIVFGAVQYYVFEVFAAGANPSVAMPVASQNLGLPAVVNGECTVDVKSTIVGLAPGSYIATVSSLSATEGKLRSSPFAFTR